MLDEKMLHEIITKYAAVSLNVMKKSESLIKERMGNDLTTDQFYILRYIYHEKECTSSQLAEGFEVNKSAITAIINRLVDRKLIERTRDENDRRVVYLTLTDIGNKLFEKKEEQVHCLIESIITKFNMEEIRSFLHTYEKLADMLSEMNKNGMEE